MSNAMDNARKIEAALELLRQSPLAIQPETFDLSCVCAVEDRPYTLRFTRQESGLFRWTESIKVFGDGKASRAFGQVPASTKLKLEEIEVTPLPCAWCGNRSVHHCKSDCGAFVCGALIQGRTFHCRKSCGATWVGTPLKEVQGSAGSPVRRPAVSPEPAAPSVSPAPNRLQLGVGSVLAKRGG